ncbi:flagellar biosynthesis protein FlhF [Niallia nealsonii]|uniref:Flagellar biosynthesis protein FlhF n=1 Tax=Niallia nealsonii TaxID=115979 RepID=A0A2N0Z5Z5_9BACI|nr:flagellar biosynthesis protein FlhF [Niallia nealsonii]PKG24922.1 flagellar biosynthesis protein FlhF [Niallia nealsonii]
MKIKKFIATSMPEAMKQVREQLGSEAVILHSKVIYTGGFLGVFKKRNIEVLAAIDPETKQEKIQKKTDKINSLPHSHFVAKSNDSKENRVHSSVEKPDQVLKQLNELSRVVKEISEKNAANHLHIPSVVLEEINVLEKQEIDKEIRETILANVMEKWYAEGGNKTAAEVKIWIRDMLLEKLSPYSFGDITYSKKYVNVIGPTGVGKTTTLAKMAAELILKHQKKIGFITTDTYRIAAIEQLKTYANILNVPLEVCYNLEDFENATKKLAMCDIILIDTAGRNFRNQKYVEDLQKVVDYKREMETLLVLSLTAKQRDMEVIYQQFSTIRIDHFIFTKIDETSAIGSMLNLIMKYKKGVAYITTGQSVPEDMLVAAPHEIVNRIIEVE